MRFAPDVAGAAASVTIDRLWNRPVEIVVRPPDLVRLDGVLDPTWVLRGRGR